MARNGVIAPDYKPQFLEARKAKGLTQKDVSEKLGHSDPSTYRDYEKGRVMPNGETLCKLADLFDVSTDYLLGRCPNYKTMGNAYIGEYTGLTDQNIEILHNGFPRPYIPKSYFPPKDKTEERMEIFNKLISKRDFMYILDSVRIMSEIADYWDNAYNEAPSIQHGLVYVDRDGKRIQYPNHEKADIAIKRDGEHIYDQDNGSVELVGGDSIAFFADKATRLFRKTIVKIAKENKTDGND